jgi:hypothetical protein
MSQNDNQHPLIVKMEEEYNRYVDKLKSSSDCDLKTMLGLLKGCSEKVGAFIESQQAEVLLICTPIQPGSLRRLKELLGFDEE